MDEKKITVRINEDLYKKFKIKLFNDGEKMKDVVAELITKYVEGKEE